VASVLEQFGRNVRKARLGRGWTQEDLAHASGLATVQISRIERGVREVRLTTPAAAAQGAGRPAATLLKRLY